MALNENAFMNQKQAVTDLPENIQRLTQLDNFYLSPHIAFYTNTAIKNMVEMALDDAVTLANGGYTDNEMARSNVISFHTPLNEETRNLADQAFFDKIQPGTILLNMARGEIVDMTALETSLNTGQLYGAAVDVTPGDYTWAAGGQAREIYQLTVAIIGVGRIGSAFAQMLHALGAEVLGVDPVYRAQNEVFVEYTTLDDALLAENGIKQIALRQVGYDVFDVPAAFSQKIRLSNVAAYSPRAIAEYTLTQLFNILRHNKQFERAMATEQNMKILMYNTVPEEQPFVTAWMAKTGHEVVTLSEPLTVDNAGQAAGFDAVSTQQTTAMPAPVYQITALLQSMVKK
ncbi:hypothetical protein GQS40_13245|uniref:3-phosphoglycerate dehydrogenase n=1 Tax=Leuconostoc lactis TaxID=1246 RepID=A0A6L7A7Z6_LEULA|nr:hypothetical protein [Leuconostoc lactis]